MALNIIPDRDEYVRLISAYSQSHRSYHTLKHLSECLEKLDWAISEYQVLSVYNSKLVEVALWYHDAVYQPQQNQNEQNSANWAIEFFSKSGLPPEKCQLIRSLILATCHRQTPVDEMHRLIVDIDLSILGAKIERFQEYESQIRQEYYWVARSIYTQKRKELLSFFLSKTQIYLTQLFYENFENRAQENISRLIEDLNIKVI
ncbi:N-methyl-D-aspartate receptor NMDAR2C subunit [Oscillatoriales cyanobacterium LEGE 11467]|uniref:N-methyl-D-aspartate receptor NMDAR2C subunit n=1 Tax=Zarconia navalis LEGE 11467 TaxID=1828826 RepID=A0A928VZZ8_9CYAN|nr:N-methyl-D-aspartate receptor NMDAR2C subunit [Zarconia navalis LEGE 11467]